jgi:hypothetical protein
MGAPGTAAAQLGTGVIVGGGVCTAAVMAAPAAVSGAGALILRAATQPGVTGAIFASVLQGAGVFGRFYLNLPIPQSLNNSAPASQGARVAAAAAAARAAQLAAKNNPQINRPGISTPLGGAIGWLLPWLFSPSDPPQQCPCQ